MKYYVVSDIHGFYSILRDTLKEKGFFEDEGPKKLVVCGDAFDRGLEAVQMSKFLYDLHKKDQLIYIKGNHEWLYLDLVNNLEYYLWDCLIQRSHHSSNGTFSTVIQLSNMLKKYGNCPHYDELLRDVSKIKGALKRNVVYSKLIPAAVNYYETEHYVFTHGWIPCEKENGGDFVYNPNWRNAPQEEWKNVASWTNGISVAMGHGIKEPEKTIICGHYHTSFGHSNYHHKGSLFGEDAIFAPFIDDGIIAIDACTAYSKTINCIVIED